MSEEPLKVAGGSSPSEAFRPTEAASVRSPRCLAYQSTLDYVYVCTVTWPEFPIVPS